MDENRLHHLIRGWTLALEVQDGSLGYFGSVFGRGKWDEVEAIFIYFTE